jgi:hypothetical protein
LDEYFPLIVGISGKRIDADEMRQLSEGYERYFARGERYTVLNVTPRDFEMPDYAGRTMVAEWVHHPRIRDFTKRLCIGAVSVQRSMLYRVAFNVVMALDRPATEMKCVATLEEGLDYCFGRLKTEKLALPQPFDLIRHQLVALLGPEI